LNGLTRRAVQLHKHTSNKCHYFWYRFSDCHSGCCFKLSCFFGSVGLHRV